jgi:hypothetical protein
MKSLNENFQMFLFYFRDEYALKVQASDGVWNLDTVITVTIQDANDNKPIFDQDIYEFDYVHNPWLERSKLISDTIGKVHALDRDAVGPNSEVNYELSHVSDFFEINEFTGEIFAKDNLKPRTPNDSYQIRVIVKDGGSPPMSSECQVIVNLMNTTNHAPQFSHKEDHIILDEIGVPTTLPLSTVVLKLNATDQDGDDLRYFIVNGNDVFGIVDQDLMVMKPLNLLQVSS